MKSDPANSDPGIRTTYVRSSTPQLAHAVGHSAMDKSHEEFVYLLDLLRVTEQAELLPLLCRFKDHLVEHFGIEDSLMIAHAFPGKHCHMDEHIAVLTSVADVIEQLRNGDDRLCSDLIEHLGVWFPRHVEQLDAAVAQWICNIKLGGKPVLMRNSRCFDSNRA